ncbi:MAG TPA: hypothetical protein ENI49_05625 [Thermoplasmatales archaeon]|nr:hypothetical protein [Thermoplasmatales archaeon]
MENKEFEELREKVQMKKKKRKRRKALIVGVLLISLLVSGVIYYVQVYFPEREERLKQEALLVQRDYELENKYYRIYEDETFEGKVIDLYTIEKETTDIDSYTSEVDGKSHLREVTETKTFFIVELSDRRLELIGRKVIFDQLGVGESYFLTVRKYKSGQCSLRRALNREKEFFFKEEINNLHKHFEGSWVHVFQFEGGNYYYLENIQVGYEDSTIYRFFFLGRELERETLQSDYCVFITVFCVSENVKKELERRFYPHNIAYWDEETDDKALIYWGS